MSGKEEDAGDIVEKVKAYLFEAEDFESSFLEWGQENCDVVDLDSEEMKLEYVRSSYIATLRRSQVRTPSSAAGILHCTTSSWSSLKRR